MDMFTHALSALICTEPIAPPQTTERIYARWRERAAVILGALLPDCDALLGLPETMGWSRIPLYANYHRVATHSIIGLTLVAALAAWIAWAWPERALLPSLRTRSNGPPIDKPRWMRLWAFAGVATGIHFLGDWITAWGTLKLLWPFSQMDFQLGRVNSLEPVLLTITLLSWAVQHYFLDQHRRKAGWIVCGIWFALCVAYVIARPWFGAAAFV